MAQHNLSTIVGFEFLRTVRKRGFWIAVLAAPVVIAIIFALSSTSNSSISDSSEAQAEAELAFAYTDASGTIPEELAAAYGQPVTDSTAAIDAVKTGKLDAFAGGVQILVLLAPVVIGYVFFRTRWNIPHPDLSRLPLEPGTMVVAFRLLIGGFALFTGVMAAIGAIMPTAKDAAMIFGPLIFAMFILFYAISLIISYPGALIVQVFTFFPLSTPVTAMLRNGFSTLDPLTAGIVIAELFVLGVLVLRVAVQLFRYGSIAYTDKLNPRAVLGRGRSATVKN